MSSIVKRVVFLLIVIVFTILHQQGKMWDEANPNVTEAYKLALDEYIPVPTKDSVKSLRESAYEVEVQENELDEIRTILADTTPYHFTSFENMRLVHFYSVIMNRYEPNDTYRDTALLAEYVYDGIIPRGQLHNAHRLSPELYVTLFDTISKLDDVEQDAAIQRVANDFLLYADAETKQTVYGWQELKLTYDVATEYLNVQQKFYDALK